MKKAAVLCLIIGFIGCKWDNNDTSYNSGMTAIAYGNGRWVAGGANGKIIYSDDGINWTGGDILGQIANTEYTLKVIDKYAGTAYGNTPQANTKAANCEFLLKMVDKVNSGTSSYGTGAYATLQVVDTVNVIDACNRLVKNFVTGGAGGSVFFGNPKAQNGFYNAGTILGGTKISRIVFGNGKFLAVINNGKTAYSTNGINWNTGSDLPSSSDGYYAGVAYGSGKFVASQGPNSYYSYSTDGINWSRGSASRMQKIIYGGDKFVGTYLDLLYYSYDGISWYGAGPSLSSSNIFGLGYGNGRYILFTHSASNNNWFGSYYSSDGINWTSQSLPSDYFGINSVYIAYGNGKFVAAGGSKIMYSNDGLNWTDTGTGVFSGSTITAISFGSGMFVAGSDNNIAYSTDGINWTSVGILGYTIASRNSLNYINPNYLN